MILDETGKPIKRPGQKSRCPKCGCEKIVKTSGFGPNPNLCCGKCGHPIGDEEGQ